MHPSERGRGGRGLFLAIVGGAWLIWAAVWIRSAPIGYVVAAAVVEIFLVVLSLAAVRSERVFSQLEPTTDDGRKTGRAFWIVFVLEFVAIIVGVVVVESLGHFEFIPVWTAFVVGGHFLPLARIFNVPVYTVMGSAIMLWCVLCALLLHGNALAASAAVGTGVLVWATSLYTLNVVAVPRLRSG